MSGIRLAVLLAILPAALLAQRRPMTVDDLLAVQTPSSPVISPDGGWVAFAVSTPNLGENRNVSRIWLVPSRGGTARALSDGPGTDHSPRWSPDGRSVAFISTREDGPQVWQIFIDGDSAQRVSRIVTGVKDFFWSRDGTAIYLTSDLQWPGQSELDRREGAWPTEARLWTDLFYRHWDEWRVGIRSHLFRLELSDSSIRDITPIDRDVPTLALGGSDLAMSHAGTELAVTYNDARNQATSTNNDIFVMGPNGAARQPITTNPANDHSPTYSPGGRYVAFLATQTPGFESDRQRIMLYERATGRVTPLTGEWDRSVTAIHWAGTQRIIAEVVDEGEVRLYSVGVPGGRVRRIVSGGANQAVDVGPAGDFMVFVRESGSAPPEVYRAEVSGRGLRALTSLNRELVARLDISALRKLSFSGAQGATIQGWLMQPPGFDPGTRYPLLYLVHGGPRGAWLDSWSARWNYALFAARGYVVAAVNPHGSAGYGQQFVNSVSRNRGGLPLDDLMAGIDHLAGLPYVDTSRMGAAGASYGGYMIYWMAGHTSRFRAMAAHAGVYNPVSMSGTTEELWFPQWEFGGSALAPSARANMEKWSPANFASRWTTPMLVTHGQQDFRVDVSEGMQAYSAARLRGIPAQFLYFPDEGHWVLKPRNRRLWWGVVQDWFDTWLKEQQP